MNYKHHLEHNQNQKIQIHVTQQYFTQVKFLSKIKELAHHQLLQKLQGTCPSSKLWAKEVRKGVLKRIKSTHNYGQAPAMMAPVQHLYSHLGTQVQVGHTYSAQLVVEMTILGKIVNKITFCSRCRSRSHATHNAEHLPRQVRAITFVCTVVAKNMLQVIAQGSPVTTGRSLGQYQGTSTVLDHIS